MPIPVKNLGTWSTVVDAIRTICETIPTRETPDSLLFEDDRITLVRARDAEDARVEARIHDRDDTVVCRVDARNVAHTLRPGRWMAFVMALAGDVREERRRRRQQEKERRERVAAVNFSPVTTEAELFERYELSLPEVSFDRSALAEPSFPFDELEGSPSASDDPHRIGGANRSQTTD